MQYTCKELKQISRGALAKNWGFAILAYLIIQAITSLVLTPFQSPLQNIYLMRMQEMYAEVGMGEIFEELFGTISMPSMPLIIISFAATFIVSLISMILTAGQYKFHLSLLRNERPNLKELFLQFKYRPDRFILANLLLIVIAFACIVPILLVAGLIIFFAIDDYVTGALIAAIALLVVYIACIVLLYYFQFKYSQIMFLLADHPDMGVMESFRESSRMMKGNIGSYLYMTLSFIPMELLAILTMGAGTFFVMPYLITVQAAFYMDVSGDFFRRQEEARRLEEEMGPVLSE